MANWDVIVLGLGGVGSAALYHLAERGNRVLGIDQYAAAHDLGSSHGQTRIIRQAYFEHPAYVPLLQRAYELWDELSERSKMELFCRSGLVEMGPADGIVIPGILRSAKEYQLDIEALSCDEITKRWPGLCGVGLPSEWRAVVEHNAGYLRVERCVEAHLKLATEFGANRVHGSRAIQWNVDGHGVRVKTSEGTETAEKLLIAAGPWSGGLLSELGAPLQILRKHQYWFATSDHECDENRFPCFFHETDQGCFYGFPSIDDRGVKVSRHSGGRPIQAPTNEHPLDEEDLMLTGRYVRDFLPSVTQRLLERAGCYYTLTPDEHFIVDRHPENAQVVVVGGLSGHGFKFTSVLGEIAADLAFNGETPFQIDLFNARRF